MNIRILAVSVMATGVVLLGACAPLTVEPGRMSLQPTQVGTVVFHEREQDPLCGFDRWPIFGPIPASDLRAGEVATGFLNSYRRENVCARRDGNVHQGFVRFNTAPVRDLGTVSITRATLRMIKRPAFRTRSISDGLEVEAHCAQLRIPTAAWPSGYTEVRAKADVIPTAVVPGVRLPSVGNAVAGDKTFDVTQAVRRDIVRRGTTEFGFESLSDQRFQPNNDFCLHILGGFVLDLEYEVIRRAAP